MSWRNLGCLYRCGVLAAILLPSSSLPVCFAQQEQTPQEQLRLLTEAVDKAQAQVEASRQQLLALKGSLDALQQRLSVDTPTPKPGIAPANPDPQIASSPTTPTNQDDELRDRLDMEESQLATLDQSKVESGSKYPVSIDGLILSNGFINTSRVDVAPLPAIALTGSGSTGATLRQTFLGIHARGPQFAGATSQADLHVDFFGNSTQAITANVPGLLRLRTAHASLQWVNSRAFIEFDRPIISPNTPSSLVSTAEPALAWSGNLWAWVPQIGGSHSFNLGRSNRMAIEGALIDVPDPPALLTTWSTTQSTAEASRWPGSEIHVELSRKEETGGPAIGLGGFLSRHQIPGNAGNVKYNAWAGTLDFRTPLPLGLKLSGSFYRGLALGGLGAGAYKDYVYASSGAEVSGRPLDDVGGWAQIKRSAGPRLDFNAALGLDNAFANELRQYPNNGSLDYPELARNRTFFVNAIYSPSAYLLFSLEYRRIATAPISGAVAASNVIGIAAGYKF